MKRFVFILIVLCAANIGYAWQPPVGIPVPSFGIEETHNMYAGQTFAPGGFVYRDAGNGPYTHYVDNSVACTDTSNTYGTQATPRCTIPSTVPAGSVIEVHGTFYNLIVRLTLNYKGTAANPIFLRGVGRPRITSSEAIQLNSPSYAIIEGFVFDSSSFTGVTGSDGGHHLSIRNNEIKNSRRSAIVFWGNNHVAYNNTLHDNEDRSIVEPDWDGVFNPRGSSYIWIVDNQIYKNGGDAVLVGDTGGVTSVPFPHHIFIGRNVMHEDRENAVDIKNSNDVIVSQNTMYGYVPNPNPAGGFTANGEIVVVHGGNNAFPQRIWIIDNVAFSSVDGIVSTGSDDLYILGNLIFNVYGTTDPTITYYGPAGVKIYSSGPTIHIHGNTIWDVENGISLPNNAAAITNNIIGNIRNPTKFHIGLPNSSRSASTIDNNIFSGTGTSNLIDTYTSLAAFRSAYPGKCTNCTVADPAFVNSAGYNFTLQSSSPAIDAGISLTPLSDIYASIYGVNLLKDLAGTARPQNSVWDIGAYEYDSGNPPPPPAPPTCTLTIPSTVQTDVVFPLQWNSTGATHAVFSYTGNTLYNSTGGASLTELDLYYIVNANGSAQIKATSGTTTLNFCFDTQGYTGTYAACLGRNPHAVCNQTITVSGSDTAPPSRSSGQPAGTLPSGTTQAALALVTDEAATCRYSSTPNTTYASMTNTFSTTGGTSHTTTVTGLSNGNSYDYYVRCTDASSNANINDYQISFSISSVQDTAPPSVSIISPLNNSVVSGTTAFSASASDNAGVAGVTLKIDGIALPEITTAPYSISWITKSFPDGFHNLTATARDTSNNTTTSPVVVVFVNNSVPSSYDGLQLSGFIREKGILCENCTINVTLTGMKMSMKTNSTGEFSILIQVTLNTGNSYSADIILYNSTVSRLFRKRISIN